MRIVLFNPHIDDFVFKPPQFLLLKRKPLRKYQHLANIVNLKKNVYIFNDQESSCFIDINLYQKFPKFLKFIVSKFEIFIFKKINKEYNFINLKPCEINEKDVLFGFSYKSLYGNLDNKITTINKFSIKIFHLSHYFISTSYKSNFLKNVNNCFLAGDSDITDNEYFNHYFNWYSNKFLILPFYVNDRFKFNIPFENRKSKILATGSFHNLSSEKPYFYYSDYINFTNNNSYHPIREYIYLNQDKFINFVDCKISPFREDNVNFFSKIFQKLNVNQKKYFSINLVDLYNNYKFSIIGEEFTGFPALGAFEAMACGSILIGNPKFYKGLGLVENYHYIAYDGKIDNLEDRINDLKNINQIQLNSLKFIKENFYHSTMIKIWLNEFKKINRL